MTPRDRFRFSLFYFCYYAAIGAYTAYVGRWVAAMGYGGYVVGGMLGLWYATRIVAPPVWAALVARSSRPGMWLVYGCALGLLCFAGFTATRTAAELLAVMAAFGFFYNAVLPQFEAMTLTALGTDSHDYGRIRLWGSLGFVLVAGSYGALLDRVGDAAFPWVSLPLLILALLAAWPHRNDEPPKHIATVVEAGHLWKRPGVRRFLLMALLAQAGFGTFYVFFTLHLQDHHHDGLAVGILWAAGVIAEIVMFWFAPGLVGRIGASRLLSWCLAIGVLRWAVTALYAESFAIMFAAQLTHAFSFAVFQACCMRLMAEYFPGRRAAAGQSLLYGFSSGVGGVLGAAIATVLWHYGRGEWAFMGGAGLTAIALVVHTMRRSTIVPVAG
jgi:MFS transporter, PPP family, 3-phenylpropionic acid transporter